MITLLVAFLLAVVGTARATRLVVHDSWPPAEAFRVWWTNQTEVKGGWRRDWSVLVTCPFCASPYIAAVVLGSGIIAGVWDPDLSTLAGWWWVLAAWATVSYLAAMLVLRDEPAED